MNITIDELTNKNKDRIIFETVTGSVAYGTQTAQSDTDIRGIFILSNSAYAALDQPPDQVSNNTGDNVYYSLRRFLQLASVANPNIIELFYMPNDCIRSITPAMERLISNRDLFISKQCFNTHVGYAEAQVKKAQGRNKWINNPQPEQPPPKENFCWVILLPDGGCRNMPESDFPCRPIPLASANIDLCEYHCASLEHCHGVYRLYHYGKGAKGVFRKEILVCQSIPKEDERKRFFGLLIFKETAWKRAQNSHRNYWQWRNNRNEARWHQQERGELDYDAKNMMHTFRLLLSCENILRNAYPRVRFEGGDLKFLMNIRAGKYIYSDLINMVKEKVEDLQILKRESSIPDKLDMDAIQELYGKIADF